MYAAFTLNAPLPGLAPCSAPKCKPNACHFCGIVMNHGDRYFKRQRPERRSTAGRACETYIVDASTMSEHTVAATAACMSQSYATRWLCETVKSPRCFVDA